ncbi:hypothetical protein DQ354_15730 [Arthrobacter sp. AQ5-06]|nr:hypothetical protein DQ354_15730 [Arthrobacter sp. AQ5-06]
MFGFHVAELLPVVSDAEYAVRGVVVSAAAPVAWPARNMAVPLVAVAVPEEYVTVVMGAAVGVVLLANAVVAAVAVHAAPSAARLSVAVTAPSVA